MPDGGNDFYATCAALDAVLLLVLVIEQQLLRAGDPEGNWAKWMEYLIAQFLLLSGVACVLALFKGGTRLAF